MPITINGSGTVTGISAGGLPDGTVDEDTLASNSVSNAKMKDDAVATAELADDAVDSARIADNAVVTAAIADNAVTAPKTDLSIVQGDVIYGTGTDTWARLAKGTASQVLTMNSGATAPAWAAVAAGSTPAFCVNTDSFAFTSDTWSKFTGETEIYDSGGKWDTSNHRFTPGVAGEYLFGWHGTIGTGNANLEMQTLLYKNGSSISTSKRHGKGVVGNHPSYPMSGGTMDTADTDDYYELWVWHNSGSGWTRYYSSAHFWGIKIA